MVKTKMTTDPNYRKMTKFLVDQGTNDVPHTGGAFLAHLVGVYKDLQAWDAEIPVGRAGMFHSIYGTEMFQGFSFPENRRDEIKELIGERAEFLAWINCVMDRDSFYDQVERSAPYRITNRITGYSIELDEQQFTDLCTVHLCDWLEQLPRLKDWDYRRESFKQLAVYLGGVARESFDDVYVKEESELAGQDPVRERTL